MPTGQMTSEALVNTHALDAKSIQSIQLPDGSWYNVKNCEFLSGFAVGQANSPITPTITPTKLYPALRYQDDNGHTVVTPLRNIVSFSDQLAGGSFQTSR